VVVVMVCGLLRINNTAEAVSRPADTANMTQTLGLIRVQAVLGQTKFEAVCGEF
jgi:hypothetical protein